MSISSDSAADQLLQCAKRSGAWISPAVQLRSGQHGSEAVVRPGHTLQAGTKIAYIPYTVMESEEDAVVRMQRHFESDVALDPTASLCLEMAVHRESSGARRQHGSMHSSQTESFAAGSQQQGVFRAYASALDPGRLPDVPLCWDSQTCDDLLRASNVGMAVKQKKDDIHRMYQKIQAWYDISGKKGLLQLPSEESVMWAFAHRASRGFPHYLSRPPSSDGAQGASDPTLSSSGIDSAGAGSQLPPASSSSPTGAIPSGQPVPPPAPATACMLPVLDLLNHHHSARMTWLREEKGLSFRTDKDLRAGEQVYNTYGPKGNEELLLGYGFIVDDNPADSVAVAVSFPPRDSPRGAMVAGVLSAAGLHRPRFMIRGGQRHTDSHTQGAKASQAAPGMSTSAAPGAARGSKSSLPGAEASSPSLSSSSAQASRAVDGERHRAAAAVPEDVLAVVAVASCPMPVLQLLFSRMWTRGMKALKRLLQAKRLQLLTDAALKSPTTSGTGGAGSNAKPVRVEDARDVKNEVPPTEGMGLHAAYQALCNWQQRCTLADIARLVCGRPDSSTHPSIRPNVGGPASKPAAPGAGVAPSSHTSAADADGSSESVRQDSEQLSRFGEEHRVQALHQLRGMLQSKRAKIVQAQNHADARLQARSESERAKGASATSSCSGKTDQESERSKELRQFRIRHALVTRFRKQQVAHLDAVTAAIQTELIEGQRPDQSSAPVPSYRLGPSALLHPGRLVELGGEAGRILATAVQGSDARFQVAALLMCLASQCPAEGSSFGGSEHGVGAITGASMDQDNDEDEGRGQEQGQELEDAGDGEDEEEDGMDAEELGNWCQLARQCLHAARDAGLAATRRLNSMKKMVHESHQPSSSPGSRAGMKRARAADKGTDGSTRECNQGESAAKSRRIGEVAITGAASRAEAADGACCTSISTSRPPSDSLKRVLAVIDRAMLLADSEALLKAAAPKKVMEAGRVVACRVDQMCAASGHALAWRKELETEHSQVFGALSAAYPAVFAAASFSLEAFLAATAVVDCMGSLVDVYGHTRATAPHPDFDLEGVDGSDAENESEEGCDDEVPMGALDGDKSTSQSKSSGIRESEGLPTSSDDPTEPLARTVALLLYPRRRGNGSIQVNALATFTDDVAKDKQNVPKGGKPGSCAAHALVIAPHHVSEEQGFELWSQAARSTVAESGMQGATPSNVVLDQSLRVPLAMCPPEGTLPGMGISAADAVARLASCAKAAWVGSEMWWFGEIARPAILIVQTQPQPQSSVGMSLAGQSRLDLLHAIADSALCDSGTPYTQHPAGPRGSDESLMQGAVAAIAACDESSCAVVLDVLRALVNECKSDADKPGYSGAAAGAASKAWGGFDGTADSLFLGVLSMPRAKGHDHIGSLSSLEDVSVCLDVLP